MGHKKGSRVIVRQKGLATGCILVLAVTCAFVSSNQIAQSGMTFTTRVSLGDYEVVEKYRLESTLSESHYASTAKHAVQNLRRMLQWILPTKDVANPDAPYTSTIRG